MHDERAADGTNRFLCSGATAVRAVHKDFIDELSLNDIICREKVLLLNRGDTRASTIATSLLLSFCVLFESSCL